MREELLERNAVAADEQPALRLERLGKGREPRLRLVRAAALHLDRRDLAPLADDEIHLAVAVDVSVFIRVAEDTPVVDLFSTVLGGAEPSLELLEALNERNNRSRFVMFSLKDSDVMAYVGVDAKLFVPEILTRALGWLADASATARTELRQQFAGKIAFEGEPEARAENTEEAVN